MVWHIASLRSLAASSATEEGRVKSKGQGSVLKKRKWINQRKLKLNKFFVLCKFWWEKPALFLVFNSGTTVINIYCGEYLSRCRVLWINNTAVIANCGATFPPFTLTLVFGHVWLSGINYKLTLGGWFTQRQHGHLWGPDASALPWLLTVHKHSPHSAPPAPYGLFSHLHTCHIQTVCLDYIVHVYELWWTVKNDASSAVNTNASSSSNKPKIN